MIIIIIAFRLSVNKYIMNHSIAIPSESGLGHVCINMNLITGNKQEIDLIIHFEKLQTRTTT